MEQAKPSRLGLIVTIAVVGVILLAAIAAYVGYRVGRNVQKVQTNEEAAINAVRNDSSNNTTNSTSSTDDTEEPDTSTWSTYSQSTSPFTFKFPTDWETEDLVVIEPNTGAVGIRPKTLKEDYILLITTIQPALQSFKESVAHFKTNISDNSTNIQETTVTKFGQQNVTKISYTNKVSGYNYSEYILSFNGKTYEVTGESNDPANTTANKILTTLAFRK